VRDRVHIDYANDRKYVLPCSRFRYLDIGDKKIRVLAVGGCRQLVFRKRMGDCGLDCLGFKAQSLFKE